MDFKLRSLPSWLFSVLVIATLVYGWQHRDSNYITAESGSGYLLGVIGGSLMLVLLLYPLSKRVKLLSRLIPLRYWFGLHMALGVLGPLMILFHANFQLGSINSNVALFCMLLVAGSGLIGRYIYTRIHHGLYGRRIELKELRDSLQQRHDKVFGEAAADDDMLQRLQQLEQKTVEPYTGIIASIAHLISLSLGTRRLRSTLHARLADGDAEDADTATVDRYFASLRHIAKFRLYERAFSLWHILHLPLFFMMLITAVIHIFAVHLY